MVQDRGMVIRCGCGISPFPVILNDRIDLLQTFQMQYRLKRAITDHHCCRRDNNFGFAKYRHERSYRRKL